MRVVGTMRREIAEQSEKSQVLHVGRVAVSHEFDLNRAPDAKRAVYELHNQS